MSGLKVVEGGFGKKPAEPSPQAIELLRDGLERAQESGVRFALVIMVDAEGNVIDGYNGSPVRPYLVVGAIEALKRDFINHEIEAR